MTDKKGQQQKPAPIQPLKAPTELSPEVMQQLAQNQAHELHIRAEELALKKQQDANGFAFAKDALAAQIADRQSARTENGRARKHTYVFVVAILLVVFVFLGYLVGIDKDAIAMEIIKGAIYLGTGALGGFYYGKNKEKPPPENK